MTKQRPLPWAACLLLAACGRADKAPKNSVTIELPAPGASLPPESRYSPLDQASCGAIEGSSSRRCEGLDGYALETGPGRMTIIAPDGRRSNLDLSPIARGKPRFGAKAEWRGAARRPTALIVRMSRNLAVARLEYPACIVAVVKPQARQNERAREIADGKMPACLKD